MARTRIKICGLRDADHARIAAESGADFVGLVFVEASPRHVTAEQAREVARALPESVEPVGLFANQPLEQVRDIAADVGLRTVQLHGDEDRAFVEALDGLKLFKAVPFDPVAIDAWRDAPASVVTLLIDTPPQPGGLTGGSGRAFDWSALAGIDRTSLPPITLAGGLTPANVVDAVSIAHPWAVDVSSGVESARGVKDPALIREFCRQVRYADTQEPTS